MANGSGRGRFEQRTRALEALGHRGSATENEDRAADLILEELRKLNVPAHKEPFAGSDSLGKRLLVHVLVALVGLLVIRHTPVGAMILAGLALGSLVYEMRKGRTILGKLLGSKPSRNVVGHIAPPQGKPRRTLVVCAHMDTQRTGLMWRSGLAGRLAPLYQRLPGPMKGPSFPLFAAFVAQIVLGAFEQLFPGSTFVLVLVILVGVVYLVAAVLLFDWSRGTFTPGAADNATGVAAALELAERWSRERRDGIELVLLLTGCEESGALGAFAWIAAHGSELQERPHVFLVLDTLAYGAPRFIDREHTLDTHQVRYPEDVVELCAKAAARLGMEGAGPYALPTFTDGAAFLVNGVPGAALLTFMDDVSMPNYHQMSDTSDNADFAVGWRAVELAWGVLVALADEWIPPRGSPTPGPGSAG